MPLEVGAPKGKRRGAKPNSPSFDRINNDPAIGYVRGNVNIISQRANQIKSDATAAELQAVWS
jgi:hypothetical protein